DASTIIDFIQSPPTGNNLDHFCLVVDASDVAEVARRWDPSLVAEGPVSRFGAKGLGTSIYVRDPDGNLVELRHYG
ncbi:MAG TPA: hypothetical protein VE134_03450, partial [Methanomicrobiales archaeon]|nr:hypothetical protein [Methanomicrobiales archaeon]